MIRSSDVCMFVCTHPVSNGVCTSPSSEVRVPHPVVEGVNKLLYTVMTCSPLLI